MGADYVTCSSRTYQRYMPFWKKRKANIPGEFMCKSRENVSINNDLYCYRPAALIFHDMVINKEARLFNKDQIEVRYKPLVDANMFRSNWQVMYTNYPTCGAILSEAAKINKRHQPCGNKASVIYGLKKLCKKHATQALMSDIFTGKVRLIGKTEQIIIKQRVFTTHAVMREINQ